MRVEIVIAIGIAVSATTSARADRIDEIVDAGLAPPRNTPDPGVVADAAESPSRDAEQPPLPGTPPASLAENYEHRWRWLAEVGGRFGGAPIDGVDTGTLDELVLAGGLHRDRFTALGSYGVSILTYPGSSTAGYGSPPAVPASNGPTEGVMHQLELSARYAIGHLTSAPTDEQRSEQSVGDLFVQVGGGEQIIQWDRGGRLVRPELSFELGLLGALRSSHHRRTGAFLALRLEVARRIDIEGGPTCSAPCTTATPPVAWRDRSVLLETGFVFGN